MSYKLYSAFGFTLLLTLITALIITPYLREDAKGEHNDSLPEAD